MSEILNIHPLALKFPEMPVVDYAALKEDIKDNGQREPVIVYEGMVLDGRHRYRAMLELDTMPKFREFDPDKDGDPWAFVMSLNMHRRHLSVPERLAITDALLEKDPSQADSAIAAAAKVSDKTVAQRRKAKGIPSKREAVAAKVSAAKAANPTASARRVAAAAGVSAATARKSEIPKTERKAPAKTQPRIGGRELIEILDGFSGSACGDADAKRLIAALEKTIADVKTHWVSNPEPAPKAKPALTYDFAGTGKQSS